LHSVPSSSPRDNLAKIVNLTSVPVSGICPTSVEVRRSVVHKLSTSSLQVDFHFLVCGLESLQKAGTKMIFPLQHVKILIWDDSTFHARKISDVSQILDSPLCRQRQMKARSHLTQALSQASTAKEV